MGTIAQEPANFQMPVLADKKKTYTVHKITSPYITLKGEM